MRTLSTTALGRFQEPAAANYSAKLIKKSISSKSLSKNGLSKKRVGVVVAEHKSGYATPMVQAN